MRNKLLAAVAGIAAAVALSVTPALANSAGSGSVEVATGDIIHVFTVTAASSDGSQVSNSNSKAAAMVTNVKMSSASNEALEISGSLETSLYTDTSVTGGSGKKTSTGSGSITVTPVVTTPCDPNALEACSQDICNNDLTDAGVTAGPAVVPVPITYAARTQTLSANLGQICTENTSTSVVTCTDPESIDLLLSTMSAHTFNFVATGFSSGDYQVTMCIGATATATTDSISPGTTVQVGVGPGTLIADIVQADSADSLNTDGSTTFSF